MPVRCGSRGRAGRSPSSARRPASSAPLSAGRRSGSSADWLLRADPPLGPAHRASRTRTGYFLAVVLVCATAVLFLLSSSAGQVLAEGLGVWRSEVGSRWIEDVALPLIMVVPFVVVGWWHWRQAMREALAFGGQQRHENVRRSGLYGLAFVGLAGVSIGAAWTIQAMLEYAGAAREISSLRSACETISRLPWPPSLSACPCGFRHGGWYGTTSPLPPLRSPEGCRGGRTCCSSLVSPSSPSWAPWRSSPTRSCGCCLGSMSTKATRGPWPWPSPRAPCLPTTSGASASTLGSWPRCRRRSRRPTRPSLSAHPRDHRHQSARRIRPRGPQRDHPPRAAGGRRDARGGRP